jgi:hypothetical protein
MACPGFKYEDFCPSNPWAKRQVEPVDGSRPRPFRRDFTSDLKIIKGFNGRTTDIRAGRCRFRPALPFLFVGLARFFYDATASEVC